MAAIVLIILCSILIGNESFGYNELENKGNQVIPLEKTENEKFGKNVKILKRSVGNGNKVGGGIVNVDITTQETNVIQYSVQGSNDTQHKGDQQINQNYTGNETRNVENFNSEANNTETSVQGDNTAQTNHSVLGSNVDRQINDIDHNKTSGNESVSDINNSTAISESAIPSSNQTSAISHKYALSTSQNDSKNDTSDTFETPLTSVRENVSRDYISTDKSANLIGGNNLNTTPRNQITNKINNEIPDLTTEAPNSNPVTQSTSASDNLISSSPQTNTSSKIPAPTTVQTKMESDTNIKNQSTTQSSSGGNEIPGIAEPTSNSTKTNETVTNNSNSTTSAFPRASSPTPSPEGVTSNVSKGEPNSEPVSNVTETNTESEITVEPEVNNETTNANETEPQPIPEPIPEPENNTTVGEPEVSSEPFTNSTNNTESVVTNTTAKTVTRFSNSWFNASTETHNILTTDGLNKMNTTSHNEWNTTRKNETSSESSPEPTAEVNNNATDATNGNPEPEYTKAPFENLTTSEHNATIEPTPEPEKNSSMPSTTPFTTVMQNTTTIKIVPEVTPEPESEVTAEPEAENTTHAVPEPTVGNTTESRTVSTLKPTTVSTTEKNIPIPEPTNETKTTGEPSQETSVKPKTSPNPSTNSSTTVKETVEPTAEPEKYPSTEQTVVDNTTQVTPEPTEEPTDESEPEEEPEPEPEDEKGDDGRPKFDTNAFAEPGPDWKLAKAVWKEAWEFHVYFYGIAFSVLGIYCVITLIRLWNMEHLLSKHYFITLHLLVITVCVLRVTYLMVDAYNSLGKFPFGLDYFLYSTAFPCLTALFSILFYALLLATRVRLASKKVQKLWVLVLIVSFHFVLSLTTDIVVGLFSSASIMIFICQAFFILWGLLMFIGYLVLFRKLYKGAINHIKMTAGIPNERKHSAGNTYHVKPSKQKYTLGLAVKITFVSAFFGVAIVGFELYSMFGVYGVLKSNTKPDPWPWWTYHTVVRGLEVLMCLSVAYVASQPLRYKMKKNLNSRMYHYLLPCSMCCCPNRLDQNETFSSAISLDFVDSEMDHLSWLKKKNKTSSPKAPYPPHTAEKYSDPDATLLVRKIKRTSKPSMLVVEDGFVRIRREDENLPSNQYELDSRSSHSSETNAGPDDLNTGALTNFVNWNYAGQNSQSLTRENAAGVNFDNYLLQGYGTNNGYKNDESADETDIDIVVTESEPDSDGQESPHGVESSTSNKSADIFRPLSMIDLAASMESELDRAFHSNCVEDTDIISHNSLPTSLNRFNDDSNDCAINEPLCDKYRDSANYSSDSADDLSKSSAARQTRPLVRRCKSDDSQSSSPKYKNFEKNRYFSVSSVDNIGKDEGFNTHFGSNGEMRTEL